ncbi:type II toxin-antitoxin system RelE/ParE family toxin [Roseococcus suduntuyensis]|uniref:type II toxin-antitoxin system RelE/ParE family toxin n=1 Tax=Roseococcus suduntuyensis TaxID=455361 RepID=UPI001A8F0549
MARYAAEVGEPFALAFIDALERAFRRIAQHPAVGSPRYAFELLLERLRAWSLQRYPYLVSYVEWEDHLDVWRVLHTQRDFPAWMLEPEAPQPFRRADPASLNGWNRGYRRSLRAASRAPLTIFGPAPAHRLPAAGKSLRIARHVRGSGSIESIGSSRSATFSSSASVPAGWSA